MDKETKLDIMYMGWGYVGVAIQSIMMWYEIMGL